MTLLADEMVVPLEPFHFVNSSHPYDVSTVALQFTGVKGQWSLIPAKIQVGKYGYSSIVFAVLVRFHLTGPLPYRCRYAPAFAVQEVVNKTGHCSASRTLIFEHQICRT